MPSYSPETLDRLRVAVAVVKEKDLSGHPPLDPLELDSIQRIALIAEMENSFAIELAEDDIQPEDFDTLDLLATRIQAKLK